MVVNKTTLIQPDNNPFIYNTQFGYFDIFNYYFFNSLRTIERDENINIYISQLSRRNIDATFNSDTIYRYTPPTIITYGTDGSDIISGGIHNDIIYGKGGDDILKGGSGNDTIYGGDGNDTISLESGFHQVAYGDNGDDVIRGGGTNDTLYGGYGADYLNGNGGLIDVAAYQTSVTVDLQDTSKNTGEARGDIYVSIEALSGSDYSDDLYGDANRNSLWGNDGNDRLYGRDDMDILYGGYGADILDGGSSTDTAAFQTSVTVDLQDTSNNTGEAYGDVYISIEVLSGSDYNDRFYGDAKSNLIFGNDGNDILYGRDGNDTLDGDRGNDYLSGGNGADNYSYILGDGANIINDYATDGATDRISFWFNLSDSNLSLSWVNGDDLLMNFGSGDSIQVIDWKLGDDYQVEQFAFDGSKYDADQFLIDHGLYI